MFKNCVAFFHFHELNSTSSKDLFCVCILTTANNRIYSHLNQLTFIYGTSHQLKERQDMSRWEAMSPLYHLLCAEI